MPRRTRALFIDYQTSIRPGATRPQILRDWSLKTPAERTAWTDTYLVVMQQNTAMQNGWLPCHNAVNAVNAIQIVRNVQEFQETCDIAERRSLRLSELYRRVALAWRDLHNVELAQPGQAPLSLAHAINEANRADRNQNASANSAARIRIFRNKPPLPPDENGSPKMKKRLCDVKGRQLLNARARGRGIHADIENARVGLQQPGNGTWVAQRKFSGGMATGWLWLQFDDNDRIVDVSMENHLFHMQVC